MPLIRASSTWSYSSGIKELSESEEYVDDGEGRLESGSGSLVGVESGSRVYSQPPVGVLMDRAMYNVCRWGQNGVGEGVDGEVLREAGWFEMLLPLLSFLFILTHSSSSCSDEGQKMDGESTMSPLRIRWAKFGDCES